jgi:hypothetical protein
MKRAIEVPTTYSRSWSRHPPGRVRQGPADGEPVAGVHAISSSHRSSSRVPKPVAPLARMPASTSERPVPAMSRCAHGRSPTNSRRKRAAVTAPPPCAGSDVRRRRRPSRGLDGRSARGASATASHQVVTPGSRRARREGPSSVAKTGAMDRARAIRAAPVRVATSTRTVGVEGLVGVGECVSEDDAALGVGVADLDRATAVLGDDVAGPVRSPRRRRSPPARAGR